jgi:enoyl-CoA hydratase/carnithine racemase
MRLEEYQDRFKTAVVSRDEAGVLTIRLHSRGQSMIWGGLPHRELPELFAAVASDRDNRVVVLTGTGERFIDLPPQFTGLADGEVGPGGWDQIIFEGMRLVMQLLDIEVPMIAAVNGPVVAHSELAVLCDVVLAAENAFFQDAPHFAGGLVPGDSMQVIWPMLLGPNRGRYFLLTGQKLSAAEAEKLGVVAEVLPAQNLSDRASEIAVGLAGLNPVLLRNTRQVLTRPLKRAMLDDLQVGLALEGIASMSGRAWKDSAESTVADD